MAFHTINDVYRSYCDMFGPARPVRTREELKQALWARGLTRYESVSNDDLDAIYVEDVFSPSETVSA